MEREDNTQIPPKSKRILAEQPQSVKDFILTFFPLSSSVEVVRAMLAKISEGFSGSHILAMVIVLAVGQGKSCSIPKPHERGS